MCVHIYIYIHTYIYIYIYIICIYHIPDFVKINSFVRLPASFGSDLFHPLNPVGSPGL